MATLLLYDPRGRLETVLAGLADPDEVDVVSLGTPPEVFMALEQLDPRALVVPLDQPEDGAMDLLEAMAAMQVSAPAATALTSRRHSFGDAAVSAARKLVPKSVFVPRDQLDAWLRHRLDLPPAPPPVSKLTFDTAEARTEMASAWVLRDIEDEEEEPDRTEAADAAVLREIIDDEYTEFEDEEAPEPPVSPVPATARGLFERFRAWVQGWLDLD